MAQAPDSEPQLPKLRAVDLAADWGTSRAYASKLIKAGCPLTSLADAREWRLTHSKRGIGYRSKKPAQTEETPDESAPTGDKTSNQAKARPPRGENCALGSLDDSLQAAIEVEEEAYRLVQDAQAKHKDDILSIRIAAFTKAQAGRHAAEAAVQKFKEREGILIPMDRAKAIARLAWVPMLNRLRSLAKAIALEANPADDVHAESVIARHIKALIAEVRLEYAPPASAEEAALT